MRICLVLTKLAHGRRNGKRWDKKKRRRREIQRHLPYSKSNEKLKGRNYKTGPPINIFFSTFLPMYNTYMYECIAAKI